MKKCNYNYLIVPLKDEEGVGYAAIIPKFKNIHIMADTINELHELVADTIEEEIKERKKDGRPIPPPDIKTKFNGKILLRIAPNLHEKLHLEAQANQISLNKYIEKKLS